MVKAVWLAAILLLQSTAIAQNSGFKVSGTVVREDNQPPDRASNGDRISLKGSSASKVLDVGAGGAFEFTDVPPGTYQVVVGPMVTMDPITVVVTDKDLSGVRVFVPDVVTLRGTVTVEGGGPNPRFQMTFTRVDGSAQAAPTSVTVATRLTATLHSGQYRITSSGLPNGYTLKAATMGSTNLLTEPLKVSIADSDLVMITLAVASQPPWVKVSGRLNSGTAKTTSTTSVTMTGSPTADVLNVPVKADGSFEFPRVLPGSYTAFAVTDSRASAPANVTVGATDVVNVSLRMPALKEVSGRITVQGNVPMPRVFFSLAPVGASLPGGSTNVPANPQQDGTFSVQLPEGDRQISVVLNTIPAGYKLASFTYGTTDLLKNPLKVALTDKTELRVGFDATAVTPVSVSGKVTGLLTTQSVRVVLMSPVLSSIEAAVNPDGSFSFSKVIPGNYNARLSLSGLSASRPVTVSNKDVTDVNIVYPREFVVTGHVLVESEVAGPPPQIVLDAKSAATTRSSQMVNGAVIILNLKDGEYNVSARSIPTGYQLKSITYGTTDLQKAPLKIDGPVIWEVIVRLTRL